MFRTVHLLLMAAIALCLVCVGLLAAFRPDPGGPNYEWIPERQMSRSPAFGTYAPNPNFADNLTLREAPAGTIPRGWQPRIDGITGEWVSLPGKVRGELDPQGQPFPYGPMPTDAARAGRELKSPLSFAHPHAKQQGAALYAIYCQLCHGPTGMGDGPVSGRGFPAPLSFLKPQAMEMKDGEMFHILTYGKGNMPAHAVQLTPAERWALVLHVRVLQNQFTEFPNVRLADTIQIYKANCMGCHGEDGAGQLIRGKVPNVPDFSSLAWQFSKTNLEITNRIEYGDEPLMPSFRYKLSRDNILALAIYLRSFAVKEGAAAPMPALPATAAGMTPVQIFRAFCLACHNVDGKGAIVRPGMPDIPDFTVAAWQTSKKDEELSKSILSGGKFMPPMKDRLTAADADNMVKFVRAFKDGKQVVELETPQVPISAEYLAHPLVGASSLGLLSSSHAKGPWLAATTLWHDRTEFLDSELGKQRKDIVKEKSGVMPPEIAERLRIASVIYRAYCVACHGPDGNGVPAMRAALPLLPDFTRASFQDQHSDPQLMISILDGKGTQMPSNRGRVTERQARDLALVVRAFGPAGATPTATSAAPSDFQMQFEQLQRQWEALERELRSLKKTPSKH